MADVHIRQSALAPPVGDPINRTSVLTAFQSKFGGSPRLFRAPARINIIGEHTDYNDGLVLPANLDLYTWLALAPRADRQVRVHTLNFNQTNTFDLDALARTAEDGWPRYIVAVMQTLQDEGLQLSGADILIAGQIPLGSGLTSSASLETVVAFALLSELGQDIDRHRLALLAQRAENHYVGVSCGIMDQYVIANCQRNHAMQLDCRAMNFDLVPLPADAALLVLNSGVQRRLSDGSLNDRRNECEAAVTRIASRYPEIHSLRDVDLEQLDQCKSELGDRLYRRCRHVVTENQRVRSAIAAMRRNDLAALGELVSASHASLRDDFDVSCAELDTLVDLTARCDGVYGSRMVGEGFGGGTISVIEPGVRDDVIAGVVKGYEDYCGQRPWAHVLGASDPVHELDLS